MAPLGGLKGLIPDPQTRQQFVDEGVLEAKANAPHPEHGEYGVSHLGYSGAVPLQNPYAGFPVYDGWSSDLAAGEYGETQYTQYGMRGYSEPIDLTPTTHSSPSPRVGLSSMISWDNPHGAALVGDQMTALHGPEFGGATFKIRFDPTGREEITHYTTNDYAAPNENYLSPVSGQLKSGTIGAGGATGGGGRGSGSGGGGSNADTTQGYGELNSIERFKTGHSIRREQHDRMPWDFTNTHGEQNVPFLGRHPVEQMDLNGPDSPYFEAGSIDGANIVWEGRISDPTQYVQPPEVTVSPQPLPQADYYPAYSF